MCLLNKDTMFVWDERAHDSFEALNKYFASSLVLILPDYSHDFLFYVFSSEEMIGIVLVQEDDEIQENVIYYPS